MKNGVILGVLLLAAPTAWSAQTPQSAVITKVAQEIEASYVDADKAKAIARSLREAAASGALGRSSQPEAFAQEMTAYLQSVVGPSHLGLQYDRLKSGEKPQKGRDAAFEAQEEERYYGAHLNFGFASVQWLEGNIGYLDLEVFPPPHKAGHVAAAAMALLANTDALIIDLRTNGGGYGTMGALLSTYLLDEKPQPLSGIYSRATGQTTEQFSLPFVPGQRYGTTKPVYVLTSKRTFSAAEAFTYDLQALKRITVVGEKTGGGANPFEYVRVSDDYVLWLEKERSVNPITGANWQGVGVTPDVTVAADDALDKALSLARGAVAKPAK